MDCLRFAWKSVKDNGLVVLGYPSGAWFGALIGPAWNYDQVSMQSNDIHKNISKLWKKIFQDCPNFRIYLTRPIDDFGKALLGDMETIVQTLRIPDINTFWQILLEDGFSFFRIHNSVDDEVTSFKRLMELKCTARETLKNIKPTDESPFKYTWQLVYKKEQTK